MRSTTSTGKAVPGLLAAVVVSIVLGILGMHALSTHGVTGGTDHAAMGGDISGSTIHPSDGTAVGTILDAVADPLATKDGAGSDEDGGHDMAGMVMLCAAVLAATAAALLLLTLGRRRTPRFWALLSAPTTTTMTRGVTSRVGAGPPPVWEFSVIRC